MHKNTLDTTACIAHDLSLAAAYGGAIFGQQAFAPALEEIKDEKERTKVFKATCAKWTAINVPAHVVFATTWLVSRANIKRYRSSRKVKKLIRVKDVLVAGALFTGVATTVASRRLAKELPQTAHAKGSGEASAKTSREVAQLVRFVKVVAPVNAALLGGAIAMGPIIGEALIRRGGLRRMFARIFRSR